MAKKKKQSVHVVPNLEGGWDVKKSRAKRASKHFDTKAPAEKYGRNLSRKNGGEFRIHGKDGQIQRAPSHGNDPYPPKDRK